MLINLLIEIKKLCRYRWSQFISHRWHRNFTEDLGRDLTIFGSHKIRAIFINSTLLFSKIKVKIFSRGLLLGLEGKGLCINLWFDGNIKKIRNQGDNYIILYSIIRGYSLSKIFLY